MSIKPLFTATASATGGRNGHSEAVDGSVSVDLSVPKEMGGPGKPDTTTPEHLFACGYAACYGGAIDFVAQQKKKDASGVRVTAGPDTLTIHGNGGALDFVASQHKKDATAAVVTCSVTIGPRDAGGFGLMVKLHVKDDSLPKDELLALANEAHEKICPYSHATRGNVPVEIEVDGA